MATTETRTGFRLPWSQDHPETDEPTGDTGGAVEASESQTTAAEGAAQETERPDMIDATPGVLGDTTQTTETDAPSADAPTAELTAAEPTSAVAPVEAAAPVAIRKPNKLMADLAKAMQTAAEGARTDTLTKFSTDAKAHIESINVASATEAADLRRQADDDIAGIRDWSKAEIARIREQTEAKITGRKTGLDGELEDQTATTERRIGRVQARVDAFEAEMAYFFEVLLAEEDPTKLAAMAQNLPEPPDFDSDVPEPPAAHVAAPEPEVELIGTSDAAADPDAAFEAIAAAAHAADLADAEAVAQSGATEAFVADGSDSDPRIEALSLSADAAAEAEAASFAAAESGAQSRADEEIPTIDDDALAARIAGLVPDMESQPAVAKSESVSTRVVVVGLVSVASIASFKRHLGRVTGVQSVGVSSGPDGEFVFVVAHGPDVALKDAIATLPGFGARVSGESAEGLQVTARDPEADS